ncbi:MAG: YncE family protein, partial [Polyangia bacterium]
MSSKRLRSAAGVAVLLLAATAGVACSSSSSPTGSLFVVVTDRLGTPVAGATVSTTPATESQATDAVGTAFFAKVTAGGYAITAVHPTAGSGRTAGEVMANNVAHVTITLTPGVTLPNGMAGNGGGVGGAAGHGGAAGRAGSGGAGGQAGLHGGGTGGGTGGTAGAAAAGGAAGSAVVLKTPTKDTNAINLSWTATPANAFTSYRIHRNASVINILQDGTSVQYRDDTGQLGVSYMYQVGGVTAGGIEVLSNSQTIVGGVYIDVGSQIERMKVDPTRPYLYGVDKVNNSLHFINLTTNTVDKTIFVGSTPVDLDINIKGTTLYVANFGSTEIAMVDLTTHALAGSIFVDTTVGTWAGNPYRLVCTAGDTLVFTSMDQWNDLKLVDALTGTA